MSAAPPPKKRLGQHFLIDQNIVRKIVAAAALQPQETVLEIGPGREFVFGEILVVHAREGVIDPASKRISESAYRPVGRLFAARYCTTRQRFDLPGGLAGLPKDA